MDEEKHAISERLAPAEAVPAAADQGEELPQPALDTMEVVEEHSQGECSGIKLPLHGYLFHGQSFYGGNSNYPTT